MVFFKRWSFRSRSSAAKVPIGGALADDGPDTKSDDPHSQDAHDSWRAVGLQVLKRDRMAYDNRLRELTSDLRGLEADREGLLCRYADVRMDGSPLELRALERQYASLKSRIQHLEQLHEDLGRRLTLLQSVEYLKEAQSLQVNGTSSGLLDLPLPELSEALGHSMARCENDRRQLADLLDALQQSEQDAAEGLLGAQDAVREELMALSEPVVARAARARGAGAEQQVSTMTCP